MMDLSPILLVDDDPHGLESAKKILELDGYQVLTAANGQIALQILRELDPSQPLLVVTDVRMPQMSGLELLRASRLMRQDLKFVLMTAYGQIDEAVAAMKMGAVDFLTKPFKRRSLLESVRMAMSKIESIPGAVDDDEREGSPEPENEFGLIGQSQAMRELRALIQRVAVTQAPILIEGESGTGKEVVARSIHAQSTRNHQKYVTINCAAVPESLMEAELFGYMKGSYTGAHQAKPGLFELAHGGTFFLDEIGDMPLSLQSKLLRVLQDGEIRRIGATQSRRVDVRVIAATHRRLDEEVQSGRFREDLKFRLDVVRVCPQPLRERLDDLPLLIEHFSKLFSQRHRRELIHVSAEVVGSMRQYEWPGNIRELSNVIERWVVLSADGKIGLADLPPQFRHATSSKRIPERPSSVSIPLGTPLKEVEDLLIQKTMEATEGDKGMTAKLLGVNPRTIYRKLKSKPAPEAD